MEKIKKQATCHPDRVHAAKGLCSPCYDLQSLYGVSPEQYNAIFKAQKGQCAICLRHSTQFKQRLGVDHNHQTGQVRGLLCVQCNVCVGAAHEDPLILKRALRYLKVHITNKIEP